jgi:arylsulfatase A-like enzyme
MKRIFSKFAQSIISIMASLIFIFSIESCSQNQENINILLISIDSLRADRLGCYGYFLGTSPNIDKLSKKSAIFTDAVSTTSWTIPAQFSMLTGLYPMQHGAIDPRSSLNDITEYLPESLQKIGYETFGIYSGPPLSPIFGFSKGFDKYINCNKFKSIDELLQNISGQNIFDSFSGWFTKRNSKKPYFAFLHMWDVHFAYCPPELYNRLFDQNDNVISISNDDPSTKKIFLEATLEDSNQTRPLLDEEKIKINIQECKQRMALYDGEIRWTDQIIGKIIKLLEHSGSIDDTMIIITSDHGEAFKEHGKYGHSNTLFDEEIKISLIIYYPKLFPSQKCENLVSLIDIEPTIAEVLHLKRNSNKPGISLLKIINGYDRKNPILCEIDKGDLKLRSVRSSDWKFVFNQQKTEQTFFDLGNDPEEKIGILINGELPFNSNFVKNNVENSFAYYQMILKTEPYFKSDLFQNNAQLDNEQVKYLETLGYFQ